MAQTLDPADLLARMAPVRNVRLYESVIDALSAFVAAGHLGDDRRLPPERDLETQLQVSRPVLREAFRVLEMHGFIESRQGGGRYLTATHLPTSAALRRDQLAASRENLLALWEARELVECRAAELAAQHADADAHAAIARPVEAMDSMTPEAYRRTGLSLEFHLAIARASGNPFFATMVSDLVAIARQIGFKDLLDLRRYDALQDDHRPILDAIRNGDPQAARQAMARHFDGLRSALLAAEGEASGDR